MAPVGGGGAKMPFGKRLEPLPKQSRVAVAQPDSDTDAEKHADGPGASESAASSPPRETGAPGKDLE